MGKGRSLL